MTAVHERFSHVPTQRRSVEGIQSRREVERPEQIALWLLRRGGPIGEVAAIAGVEREVVTGIANQLPRRVVRPNAPEMNSDSSASKDTPEVHPQVVNFASAVIYAGLVGEDRTNWVELQRIQDESDILAEKLAQIADIDFVPQPRPSFTAQIVLEAYAKEYKDQRKGYRDAMIMYSTLSKQFRIGSETAPEIRAGEEFIYKWYAPKDQEAEIVIPQLTADHTISSNEPTGAVFHKGIPLQRVGEELIEQDEPSGIKTYAFEKALIEAGLIGEDVKVEELQAVYKSGEREQGYRIGERHLPEDPAAQRSLAAFVTTRTDLRMGRPGSWKEFEKVVKKLEADGLMPAWFGDEEAYLRNIYKPTQKEKADLLIRLIQHKQFLIHSKSRLHDDDRAQDMVSAALLRVRENMDKPNSGVAFDDRSEAEKYTMRALINIEIDYFKSARNRLEQYVGGTEELAEVAILERPSSVEEEALVKMRNQELMRAILGLSEEQQQVIMLRYLFGLSIEDTATILERNESTVKTHQRRALLKLKAQYSTGASSDSTTRVTRTAPEVHKPQTANAKDRIPVTSVLPAGVDAAALRALSDWEREIYLEAVVKKVSLDVIVKNTGKTRRLIRTVRDRARDKYFHALLAAGAGKALEAV